VALDGLWLVRFRAAGPLVIDEAAYLRFGLDDRAGLAAGGLGGLWHAIVSQRQQGPLVPALSVPLQLVIGSRMAAAFAVQAAFFVVLVASAWFVARRFTDRKWALVATLTVAAIPAITLWTRTLIFTIDATALLLAATLALLKSDRLSKLGWSTVFGFLLGLVALARTMTVAFVPGLLIAAVVSVVVVGDRWRRGLVHLTIAVGVGTAVAATWWGPNWSTVTGYLTAYGYGAEAAQYLRGGTTTVSRPAFWTAQLSSMVNGLSVPLALVLGLAVVLAVAARRRSLTVKRLLSADQALLVIPIVGGYAALTSTSNKTNGFGTPLLPLVALLGVWAASTVRWHAVRYALAGALVLCAVVGITTQAALTPALSESQVVTLPVLGPLQVTQGSGVIYNYISTVAHYRVGAPPAPLPAEQRAWMPTATRVARRLFIEAGAYGRLPVVFFATRDPFFNTNTVSLEARAVFHQPLLVGQLLQAPGAAARQREAVYRAHLTDPLYGWPNLLVIGPPAPGESEPRPATGEVEAAATAAGFRPAFSVRLPDGRVQSVWWIDRGPAVANPPLGR
jgi:4-amino-4-deoxy-L-arabinose transferase-like glycosyltransferase